jgi:hypothetical protein
MSSNTTRSSIPKNESNTSSVLGKRKYDEMSNTFTVFKLPKFDIKKLNSEDYKEYINEILIEYNELLTQQLN